MYDYHVHSSFSGDCVEKMENTILEAISKKGTQICFTDHLDYDYPIADFDFDDKEFSEEFYRLRAIYGESIIIQKGIELGLQPHLIKKCNKFVEEFKPDFVICSFHCCEGKDLYIGDYFIGKDPITAWHTYLDEMTLTLSQYTNYSVIGHIDLIKRYSEDARRVEFADIKDKLTKLLKVIIASDKGIEVNMSGLRTSLNESLPSEEIIRLYYELGGRTITIGSDAHRKEDVYSHYKEVLELLLEIGFENITIYSKMIPSKISIKKALESI